MLILFPTPFLSLDEKDFGLRTNIIPVVIVDTSIVVEYLGVGQH